MTFEMKIQAHSIHCFFSVYPIAVMCLITWQLLGSSRESYILFV